MIVFLGFFFQSDRPTRYQETHSTVNERKKGDGLGNVMVPEETQIIGEQGAVIIEM